MRRGHPRPFGQSLGLSRAMSLVLLLILIGMLYSQMRKPQMWAWLANTGEKSVTDEQPGPPTGPPAPEVVVEGPGEDDPAEQAAIKDELAVMEEKAPLRYREMAAYWRMLGWARTKSSAEMEQGAINDVAFTQLWQEPEKYRGKRVRLAMHVRRVLDFSAKESPLGLDTVYEAWGWTDESRSFPYVVVFADKPEGLPLGSDIRAEVVFTGYFLKVMEYSAFDKQRGAPLFVGRVRMDTSVRGLPPTSDFDSTMLTLSLIGAGIFAVACALRLRSGPPKRPEMPRPDNLPGMGSPTETAATGTAEALPQMPPPDADGVDLGLRG